MKTVKYHTGFSGSEGLIPNQQRLAQNAYCLTDDYYPSISFFICPCTKTLLGLKAISAGNIILF